MPRSSGSGCCALDSCSATVPSCLLRATVSAQFLGMSSVGVSGRVSSTKVPLPRERRIRPSASSRPSACRTVERAMP
ncbi:Uncharacterised protein [Bordetella pertussis]|nr:Uncharacterised protein [Bordetella pertussis]